MIQANELIINRYFELNGLIVKAIDFEGLNSLYNDIKNLKPIPLTEEWLLKFGFYKHHITKEDNQIWRKEWGEGYFDLEQIISFHFGNPMYSIECTYIHQLQNLYFVFTNEELTLKE